MNRSTEAPPQGTESGSKRSNSGFVSTLPGLLTGTAALITGKVLSTGTASGPYHGALAEICQGTGEWGNCN